MKLNRKTISLIASLAVTLLLLNSAVYLAAADGGGWPTATPTRAIATIIVITPEGKDAASVEIQGDAPLPDAGSQAQPATVLQIAPAPDQETTAAQSGGGDNLRLLVTIGAVMLVVLLIGLIVFRLRA